MRPALTRSIIRQLLREEPLVFRGCLHRHRQAPIRNARITVPSAQRRTLFGFSILRPAANRNEYNPGLVVMEEALKRQELRARMPSSQELADAWNAYFTAKLDGHVRVLDTHTRYALVVFRHLQKEAEKDGQGYLGRKACQMALRAMAQDGDGRTDIVDPSYQQLARELYASLQTLPEEESTAAESHDQPASARDNLRSFVSILALTGNAVEARDLLLQQDNQAGCEAEWRSIFNRLVPEGLVIVKDTARILQEKDIKVYGACRSILIACYAQLDAFDEIKTLFNAYGRLDWDLAPGKAPMVLQDLEPVLNACVRNEDFEYGQGIVQAIVERNLTTHHSNELTHLTAWRLIFYWAAATGKSVEEIDRMMKVSMKSGGKVPAVSVLGELMDFAHRRKDPYLGERYFALASSWGTQKPGLKAYLRLMSLRLMSGDMDGARAVWSNVQDTPLPASLDPTIRELARTTMSSLIVAMCSKGSKVDADSIMPVVDHLIKSFGEFDTNTICALSVFHLRREEYHEVVDLLKTHVPRLASQQRLQVRDVFVNFCLDRINPITRVWDAYMIFHQIFEAETDRVVLTKLMNEFYKRRQGKMALHVFNQMRDHTRADTIATEDTYVDALVAISNLQHSHGLENVHNQLKLDVNVEPTTRVLNALMLAYAMCGSPYTSWTFWRQITNSIEGPSFESILIVLRCCEFIPFGEQRATAIWSQFQRLDIEVTPELFAGYVGALAANDCIKEALELVEGAKKRYGIDVDEFVLGTLLSTIPSVPRQETVETWVQDTYPDIWQALQKIGYRNRQGMVKVWRINRTLTP